MEQAVEQPRLAQIDQPGLQEAWEMVSGQLQKEMKRADFDSWVRPLLPLSFNEGVFRVGAINSYGRDWVESRLRTRVTRLLESVYNQQLSVNFVMSNGSLSAAEPASTVEKAVESPEPRNGNGTSKTRKKSSAEPAVVEGGSTRKVQLQRAYGSERARVVQPERGMFVTRYFFEKWLPIIGHSAMATVLAARSMCFWNVMSGEMRNVIDTDMGTLARNASVSVRTVKDVLADDLIKAYFLRYYVRRLPTVHGVRTAGIRLLVRMDDPLTPEDQEIHNIYEEEHWYPVEFENEKEKE